MKLIVAILFVLFAICGNIFSQEGFQNYHRSSQLVVASPGSFRYGLSGYENPAILGPLSFFDLRFYTSNPDEKANGYRQWSLFGGFPQNEGMGTMIGIHHERFEVDNATMLTFGNGYGSGNFSFGYSLGLAYTEGLAFQRNSILRLGAIHRPNEHFFYGAHVTSTFEKINPTYEFVGDIGVRPFSKYILTFFGDVAWRNKSFIQHHGTNSALTYSAGCIVELISPLILTCRYFNTQQISIGAQMTLGYMGGSTHLTTSISNNDESGVLMYGLRAGGLDYNNLFSNEASKIHNQSVAINNSITKKEDNLFQQTFTFEEFLEHLELIKKYRVFPAMKQHEQASLLIPHCKE
jgi:hypothetical protein